MSANRFVLLAAIATIAGTTAGCGSAATPRTGGYASVRSSFEDWRKTLRDYTYGRVNQDALVRASDRATTRALDFHDPSLRRECLVYVSGWATEIQSYSSFLHTGDFNDDQAAIALSTGQQMEKRCG